MTSVRDKNSHDIRITISKVDFSHYDFAENVSELLMMHTLTDVEPLRSKTNNTYNFRFFMAQGINFFMNS